MKKQYIQPICEILNAEMNLLTSSKSNEWNDVGNFGFGDDEDDDREGDDNWDHHWGD